MSEDDTDGWYSYDPGTNTIANHDTAEEAREAAEEVLEGYRRESLWENEWNLDAGSIHWGRLVPHGWTEEVTVEDDDLGECTDYVWRTPEVDPWALPTGWFWLVIPHPDDDARSCWSFWHPSDPGAAWPEGLGDIAHRRDTEDPAPPFVMPAPGRSFVVPTQAQMPLFQPPGHPEPKETTP